MESSRSGLFLFFAEVPKTMTWITRRSKDGMNWTWDQSLCGARDDERNVIEFVGKVRPGRPGLERGIPESLSIARPSTHQKHEPVFLLRRKLLG